MTEDNPDVEIAAYRPDWLSEFDPSDFCRPSPFEVNSTVA
jgi:hypothetical protein